jgi:hypothetical protein
MATNPIDTVIAEKTILLMVLGSQTFEVLLLGRMLFGIVDGSIGSAVETQS